MNGEASEMSETVEAPTVQAAPMPTRPLYWSVRRELWERLSAALAHRPTVDDVRAIVASGRFDTLTQDESFVVLEYPHFVNAVVSRFYLEVLERAATR